MSKYSLLDPVQDKKVIRDMVDMNLSWYSKEVDAKLAFIEYVEKNWKTLEYITDKELRELQRTFTN